MAEIKCDICDMKFTTKRNLARHKRVIHEKLKPYKCEHCDFACAAKANLKMHGCYIRNDPDVKEYNVQIKVERETGGKPAKCPIGFADIVSDTEIIEIKVWKRYREAIGQLLTYSVFFPNKQKRLHFFGHKPDDETLEAINEICVKYNISLTYE